MGSSKLKSIGIWIMFLLLTLFALFPILWGVRTSLADRYDYSIIPSKITFENYIGLFKRPVFWYYLRNSLIVTFGAIATVLPISLLAAYALSRFEFKGRQYGILFLILPMLPAIAILVPLIRYMGQLGLYNTLGAVILTNAIFNLPFAIWMLRNFLIATPYEIEEAALIDGCSRLQVLWRVALPMMLPGLIAVVLFVFISTWNNYVYAFALTSSPMIRVLPQGIFAFLGSWGTDWGGLTSLGILTIIPPVVFFLFFQKWFIAGLFGQQLK